MKYPKYTLGGSFSKSPLKKKKRKSSTPKSNSAGTLKNEITKLNFSDTEEVKLPNIKHQFSPKNSIHELDPTNPISRSRGGEDEERKRKQEIKELKEQRDLKVNMSFVVRGNNEPKTLEKHQSSPSLKNKSSIESKKQRATPTSPLRATPTSPLSKHMSSTNDQEQISTPRTPDEENEKEAFRESSSQDSVDLSTSETVENKGSSTTQQENTSTSNEIIVEQVDEKPRKKSKKKKKKEASMHSRIDSIKERIQSLYQSYEEVATTYRVKQDEDAPILDRIENLVNMLEKEMELIRSDKLNVMEREESLVQKTHFINESNHLFFSQPANLHLFSKSIHSSQQTYPTENTNHQVRLTFISKLVQSLPENKWEQLSHTSRVKNRRHDIKSILCVSDLNIIQTIEGSHKNVETLYNSIRKDSRHVGVCIVQYISPIYNSLTDSHFKMVTFEQLVNTIFRASSFESENTIAKSPNSPQTPKSNGHPFSSGPSTPQSSVALTQQESFRPKDSDMESYMHFKTMFEELCQSYRMMDRHTPQIISNMIKRQLDPSEIKGTEISRVIVHINILRFPRVDRISNLREIMNKYVTLLYRCMTKYGGQIVNNVGNTAIVIFKKGCVNDAIKACIVLYRAIPDKIPSNVIDAPVLQVGMSIARGFVFESYSGRNYTLAGTVAYRAAMTALRIPELSHYLVFDENVQRAIIRGRKVYNGEVYRRETSPYVKDVVSIGSIAIAINGQASKQFPLFSLKRDFLLQKKVASSTNTLQQKTSSFFQSFKLLRSGSMKQQQND
mmetsp:Transcript_6901/g.10098  ORF Transcript_6901/g.10098 Transcript_6901/m.10098 type:complete len:784 (+) Transcript_6901:227-2578(+)